MVPVKAGTHSYNFFSEMIILGGASFFFEKKEIN